jgi:hypothetical protein
MLAGLGHAFEALAVAGEDFDAQFFFQLDDGFGHAGLRGVQRLGGFGQVQVARTASWTKRNWCRFISNVTRVRRARWP